ncbi:MAG: hypothetical protein LAO08_20280 [Acidobacteriia bacterium]|nr:hypothetical protein [Terriglobia bacterium]
MAWAYHIYRIDPGSEIIRVEHVFYGFTKAECLAEYHEHLAACTGLNAAECEDRIEEEWEELTEAELPTPNDEDDEDDDG